MLHPSTMSYLGPNSAQDHFGVFSALVTKWPVTQKDWPQSEKDRNLGLGEWV